MSSHKSTRIRSPQTDNCFKGSVSSCGLLTSSIGSLIKYGFITISIVLLDVKLSHIVELKLLYLDRE